MAEGNLLERTPFSLIEKKERPIPLFQEKEDIHPQLEKVQQ